MARPPKKIKIEECLDLLMESFSAFKDPRTGFSEIPIQDFLLSSYAIFALKYPSLLSFENDMVDEKKFHNLRTLFGVTKVPSDTHLRDIMDRIDSRQFRKIFTKLFAEVQRTKLFEAYEFIRLKDRPYYLINGDGTGYFRSDKIDCDGCLQLTGRKADKNIKKFGHNIFAAALVHPDQGEVFPFCPEPIVNGDGATKNDCEQNAFKRFIADFRREHPKLDVVINLDALFATDPPIRLMMENDCSFIVGVKETNGTVYMQVNDGEKDGTTKHHEYCYEIGDKIKKHVTHKYRYRSNVRINQNMESSRVNFVEFWETTSWIDAKGISQKEKRHFAWLTDIPVNKETIIAIAKGGRARWKIENEVFNTLKNQGYNLEHNYGHGSDNLSVNFIMMMFIAFFIDQVQLSSCHKFKEVMKKKIRISYVWNETIAQIRQLFFESWEQFYGLITGNWKLKVEIYESS